MGRLFLRYALVRYAFAIVILATAACSADTPERTGAKYSTYPENVRKAIDNGVVLKGMTQEQVVLAVGQSHCVDARIVQGQHLDSWTYHADKYTGKLSVPGRCPGDHPVIFEDGYVIEGQTE